MHSRTFCPVWVPFLFLVLAPDSADTFTSVPAGPPQTLLIATGAGALGTDAIPAAVTAVLPAPTQSPAVDAFKAGTSEPASNQTAPLPAAALSAIAHMDVKPISEIPADSVTAMRETKPTGHVHHFAHRKVWGERSPLAHPALLRFPNRHVSSRLTNPDNRFGSPAAIDRCLFMPMLFVCFVFAMTSGKDIHLLSSLLKNNRQQSCKGGDSSTGTPVLTNGYGAAPPAQHDPRHPALTDGADSGTPEPEKWTPLGMMGLTSYRFYTGFLSATWLPYLLAREGEDLWLDNQSLFMGAAKLIYGLTILFNPVFGLIGDKAATLSHGIGRRLFLRVGICVAALGIFITIYAARHDMFWTFMLGITIWRLGEALNDVTTEALVPELVPKDQWQLGSAIKSLMFLLGGVFGYVILLLGPEMHYSWLYYAYLFGMFTSVIPPLMLLSKEAPGFVSKRGNLNDSFLSHMVDAYVAPAKYQGGFSLACLAVFIFSLGTAPIFFLLLFVRDLVGMTDPVMQQQYFARGSLCFFLVSALSAVAAGLDSMQTGDQTEASKHEQKVRRSRRLMYALILFGVACTINPVVGYLPTMQMRLFGFYFQASLFGIAFGSAFTRFQECTWQALPPDANLANAMGFNVMSRLFGVGIGNFLAGIILDFFYIEQAQAYEPFGYVVLCWYSAACVFIGTAIAHRALLVTDLPPIAGIARIPAKEV